MLSIPRRVGIRQLPGICLYSAKCVGEIPANQGGTADIVYSSLTDSILSRIFYFLSKFGGKQFWAAAQNDG